MAKRFLTRLSDVIRRVGGLEESPMAQMLEQSVIRRVGGLEGTA